MKDKKFHFVFAAFKTSFVSIFNLLKIIDSSLINAIFISLWVFSITLADSATLILGALNVPALIIDLYNKLILFAIFGLDPEITFFIFVKVCFESPGLILSGE